MAALGRYAPDLIPKLEAAVEGVLEKLKSK